VNFSSTAEPVAFGCWFGFLATHAIAAVVDVRANKSVMIVCDGSTALTRISGISVLQSSNMTASPSNTDACALS
jgi:hypothetical protein